MSLTYKDLKQIAKDFRKLRWWKVLLLFIVAGVFFGLWGYYEYVKIPNLRSEIAELQKTVKDKDLENAKLHRENLHSEAILDPIRRKAEQLYPALETDVALAKLTKDIKNVRELATRDIYRPLSEKLRNAVISGLQAIQKRHSSLQVSISISTVKGSNVRHKVAEELGDILENAGFSVKVTGPQTIITSRSEAVQIHMNKEDQDFVVELCEVLLRFIDTKFVVSPQDYERGQLRFIIDGDPLFSPEGVVTFK